MKRNKQWSAIVASFAIVALAACGGGDADTDATAGDTAATTTPAPAPAPAPTTTAGTPPAGATAEMVTAGQQTFSTICAACHGPDAKGTQLAPNLTDAEWINIGGTYDEIQTLVKTGVPTPKTHPSPMPPMGGGNLSEDQVKAVAAYVWALGGGK